MKPQQQKPDVRPGHGGGDTWSRRCEEAHCCLHRRADATCVHSESSVQLSQRKTSADHLQEDAAMEADWRPRWDKWTSFPSQLPSGRLTAEGLWIRINKAAPACAGRTEEQTCSSRGLLALFLPIHHKTVRRTLTLWLDEELQHAVCHTRLKENVLRRSEFKSLLLKCSECDFMSAPLKNRSCTCSRRVSWKTPSALRLHWDHIWIQIHSDTWSDMTLYGLLWFSSEAAPHRSSSVSLLINLQPAFWLIDWSFRGFQSQRALGGWQQEV